MKPAFLIILLGGILLVGCAKKETPATQQAAPAAKNDAPPPVPESSTRIPSIKGDTVTTASGLKYVEIVVGQGSNPTIGQIIKAHYTGWLTNGTKFDSSHDRGGPLEFQMGQHRVIKGWEEGIMSMKVGGRRMLIIPPDLGWGDRGTQGGPIPPGATTVFDVELVSAVDPATKL